MWIKPLLVVQPNIMHSFNIKLSIITLIVYKNLPNKLICRKFTTFRLNPKILPFFKLLKTGLGRGVNIIGTRITVALE